MIALALVIASVVVPPTCLLAGLTAFACWWKRVRRRLPPPPPPTPHSDKHKYTVTSPSTLPTPRAWNDDNGARSRSQRNSNLSITTLMGVDGSKGLDRRSRIVSESVAAVDGEQASWDGQPLSSLSPPSRPPCSASSIEHTFAAQQQHLQQPQQMEMAKQRDAFDSSRRDWSSEFDHTAEGEGDGEEERTEELASASVSTEAVPGSAEWMGRTPAAGLTVVGQGKKEERRNGSTFSLPGSTHPHAAPLDSFRMDYLPRSRYSSPPQTDSGLGRSRSGKSDGTAASSSYGGHRSSNHHSEPVPPLPDSFASPPQSPSLPSVSPTFPPPPSNTASRQSLTVFPSNPLFNPPMHASTASQSEPHYLRQPTRSAPTLLETALLRPSSSPELRPHRQRTGPLATLASLHSLQTREHRSSADLYSLPSPLASDSTLFHAPAANYARPLPDTPVWPPSPPRTSRSPSSPRFPFSTAFAHPTSPPLTDFPARSLARPPRSARPPLPLRASTSFLTNESHRSQSSHTTAAAAPRATTTVSTKWSFRRRTSASTSGAASASSPVAAAAGTALRWSGSWSKSSASAKAERERKVSKELLAPLSASVRSKVETRIGVAKEDNVYESSGMEGEGREEIGKGVDGRKRASSVGTLASHIVRGEGVGRVGNEVGALTVHYVPALPST
ncbi:hypothetical protein JCM11641_001720 [Rhodosporidiobolus odoratus]